MAAEVWANIIAALAVVASIIALARGELRAKAAGRGLDRANAAAEQSAHAAQETAKALAQVSEQFGTFLSRQEKLDQRQWATRYSYPGGPDDFTSQTRGGRGPWAGPAPRGPSEPVVHWTVDRIEGRRHQLKNLGRATAYAVELHCENVARFDGPAARDLQPGEAVEFLAIGSMQTGTPELLVTWTDNPDGQDRREWRRPVP